MWRIMRAAHLADAWTGEGARLFGGRWNSRGVRIVYTATSLALAAMEFFVNLEPNRRPHDLVRLRADIAEGIAVGAVDPHGLAANWNAARDESLRVIGDAWVAANATVALRVPSAAVDGEWNVLLNPAHADWPRIALHEPAPFTYDARMFRSSG
ncbi:MAG: RES family NAD+ phosphorylase [Candidatus Velthaea sp.]